MLSMASMTTSYATAASPTMEVTAESLHNFMKETFNDLEEKVATTAYIKDLLHIIYDQKQITNEMNDRITVLESEITHLKRSRKDAEQNQR